MRVHLQLAAALLLPLAALAGGEDLATCRWPNGDEIKPQVCEYLRAAAARDQARADEERRVRAEERDRQAAQRDADAKATAEARAAQQRDNEQRAAAAAAARASQADADRVTRARFEAEEQARKAAVEKVVQEAERQEAREQASMAARKKACGADFGQLRVGMSVERAQQCFAPFRLVGEMAMPGGNVATYRSGWALLTVRNGQIVSYQRP